MEAGVVGESGDAEGGGVGGGFDEGVLFKGFAVLNRLGQRGEVFEAEKLNIHTEDGADFFQLVGVAGGDEELHGSICRQA